DITDDQRQYDHQQRAIGHHPAPQERHLEAEVLPELDELSHPEEERRLRFHVNGTDSLGARIPGVERAEDAPSAERDDERRQLEPGNYQAVEEAAGEPDEEPEDERGFDRPAVDDSGPAHHH